MIPDLSAQTLIIAGFLALGATAAGFAALWVGEYRERIYWRRQHLNAHIAVQQADHRAAKAVQQCELAIMERDAARAALRPFVRLRGPRGRFVQALHAD